MKVKFWGVRGSIPTPLTSRQIKDKVAAVVQRISPGDIKNAKTRETFLSKLPEYLFGGIGGNTTCVQIIAEDSPYIILDCGSGIRELGFEFRETLDKDMHILLSHFHWDHIQGLPFFPPLFNKENDISFYSPVIGFKKILEDQMKPPYFPISMNELMAKLGFKLIDVPYFKLGSTKITWRKMKHPGDSFSYKMVNGNKSVIFATDSEITKKEFILNKSNQEYFKDADLLILDSQYTLKEFIDKINWGHTSFSLAVDLAAHWKIKNLALFHYEPNYIEKKILGIHSSAKWYMNHNENGKTNIILATEGMELEI